MIGDGLPLWQVMHPRDFAMTDSPIATASAAGVSIFGRVRQVRPGHRKLPACDTNGADLPAGVEDRG